MAWKKFHQKAMLGGQQNSVMLDQIYELGLVYSTLIISMVG